MNTRRTLGTGPQTAAGIRATQADLIPSMPAVPMPDLDDLRARGALGAQPAAAPSRPRVLGTGQNSPTGSGSGSGTVADASGETNSSRSPAGA